MANGATARTPPSIFAPDFADLTAQQQRLSRRLGPRARGELGVPPPPPGPPTIRAATIGERVGDVVRSAYETLTPNPLAQIASLLGQADFPGKAREFIEGPAALQTGIARRPTAGRTPQQVFDDLLLRSTAATAGTTRQAPQPGTPLYQGLREFVDQYRRVADHIKSVTFESDPAKRLQPSAGYSEVLAETTGLSEPQFAANIELSPLFHSLPATHPVDFTTLAGLLRNTLGHEGAHVAQNLRFQDALRRLNNPAAGAGDIHQPVTNEQELLGQMLNASGLPYVSSPNEFRARTAGAHYGLRMGSREGGVYDVPGMNRGVYQRRPDLPPEQQASALGKLASWLAAQDLGARVPPNFNWWKIGEWGPAPP